MALRLAFELVVVFVGVYAAFAVSEHQARREADQRRTQIRAALMEEIHEVVLNTRRVSQSMPGVLAAYDSAIAAGARPPLEPMLEPVRIQTHIWDATLQSNAIDLLDVPTVVRLSAFYNELNLGFEQLNQLRHLSEQLLLPNLGAGADEFYDPTTGRVRPQYAWYFAGLRRLGELTTAITARGEALMEELEGV